MNTSNEASDISMNTPKSFLQLVADDLLGRSDIDFRRLVIVFPNKRASLFFNEHLRRADWEARLGAVVEKLVQ